MCQQRALANRLLRTLYGVLLIALSSAARAGAPPELLDQGKQATALVEIGKGEGFGSAFCVDAGGFFITNSHVVAGAGSNDVTLVLHSGEKNQRKLKARVVRSSEDLDLALLWVDKPGPLNALPLSDASDPIETESITVFGYPFGKDLSLSEDEYPSITVTTGHITSLRKIHGELKALQIDAVVNPGNSGGPVLNDKGQVIGVVMAGILGAGINFAIPTSDLNHFLESVSIVLTPSSIAAGHLRDSQDFVIKVAAFQHTTADMTAELTLSAGAGDHRTFAAHAVDASTFEVKATPAPVATGPQMLTLVVKEGQTELTCQAPDQKLIVGGKSTMLSALHRIERGDTTVVTFADNEAREASVLGLENMELEVLGAKQRQNLSHAESISISAADSAASSVSYRVVVRRAGKTVGELSGQFSGAEAAAGAGATTSAPHPSRPPAPQRSDMELLISSQDSDEVKRFDGRTGQFIDDFASGSGLNRPTGIAIGPDGNLYVASYRDNIVFRYNGHTGQFIDVFVDKSRNGDLNGANGMAFGPDGNLYVSSQWSGTVKRFNGSTGAFMGDFISANSGLVHAIFLLFGPDGNLYVGAAPNAVKRYNGRTGAYMGDFVSSNGIDAPMEFCFGPDGRFYLASYNSRQIKRFDGHTGQFIDNFVPAELMGQGEPTGLHFGPDGNLYVSTRANEIRRFNGKTGEYIGTFAAGNGMNYPVYILFRPRAGTHK